LRWKRQRLLWRAFRSRRALTALADRTAAIRPGQVLAVTTLRNEVLRLPWFLDYYRTLGVGHFLMVDNGSDDGSVEMLAAQPDVSLWQTGASYRDARFGLDWMTWLQIRHAHGHWCLMVDVDELLIYAHHDRRDLHALTGWLERQGRNCFGAHMLDLYPRRPMRRARIRWISCTGSTPPPIAPSASNRWAICGCRAVRANGCSLPMIRAAHRR